VRPLSIDALPSLAAKFRSRTSPGSNPSCRAMTSIMAFPRPGLDRPGRAIGAVRALFAGHDGRLHGKAL